MKRVAKKITIKEETLKDIEANNIDTNAFIERIKFYLDKANFLINNKMDDMEAEDLFKSLSEVFDIHFDTKDFLKIISLKNNKHYSHYLNIKTNMVNSDGYNVSYLCAATNKVDCCDNETLDVPRLRRLTGKEELVALIPTYEKKDDIKRPEKFESYLYSYVDVNSGHIDEDSELYPYAASLLKKITITKYVLYDLKLFVDEIIHQVRAIKGLALIKEDEFIANIGKQYQRAYERATNDRVLVKEKVSVRYHQKKKNRGYK